jgi:CheY-like chemotaxis protein
MRPRKVVLYVDRDQWRRSRRLFVMETWGYQVMAAAGPAEALARLADVRTAEVHVLFLQEPMPELDQLVGCARGLQPELRVLIAGDSRAYDAETGADVYLPEAACMPGEIRERLRVLVARKRGPKPVRDGKGPQRARAELAAIQKDGVA